MVSRVRRLLGRVAREERGFSLVELLIATLLAAVGLAAVVVTLDYSRAATTSAERSKTMAHQAERELEAIMAMDYDDIGMNAAVDYQNDVRDPRYYVRDVGTNYQWDKDDASLKASLVTPGTLAPSTSWQSTSNGNNRFSGDVWRFVTWFYDPALVQTPTDQPDAKRVIVAVTIDGDAEPRRPLFVSSMVRGAEG